LLLEPVRHRRVALLTVGELVERKRRRGNLGRLGTLQCPHSLPVRRHRCDGQPGVEQRLQVRALTADEDADHASTTLPMTRSSLSGDATTAQ
jgi:hypothetical protein